MVSAAITPPAAQMTPEMTMAVRKPPASSVTLSAAAPVRPARSGRTATARRPAARATTLLTAEATPECSAGAAPMAVDVSGATVTARPKGEEEHGREDLGPIAAGVGGAGEEDETGTDDEGPHRHLEAGSDPRRQRAGPGREGEHDDGQREQRQAGLERAVALHDLQLDGEQEQRTAEGAVDDEGDGVGPAELPGAEQPEREHRVGPAVLDDEEGGRGHGGDHEAGDHGRARPPRVGASMRP